MNDGSPIFWRGNDLSVPGARMYYRGRLFIDPIRGAVYLSGLDGEPCLDDVLPSGNHEVEIRIVCSITENGADADSLKSAIAAIDTPQGRERALAEIRRHGTPVYSTDPAHPGCIVETHPDGTTRVGRFVNKQFVPLAIDNQQVDTFSATAAEGLSRLFGAEGGCVDVNVARTLYRKPGAVTRQRIGDLIRDGEIIAYRTGAGEYSVPVWQFEKGGGILPGIPEALRQLKTAAAFEPITPFAFFLQADPLTDGDTPLQALREGKLDKVVYAATHFSE